MRSEWPRVEISKLCELIVDCVNKTASTTPGPTPYRMIRTTNVRNGRIDLADCKFVELPVFEKWTRRASLRSGDVLLTREAPIGEVGYVFDGSGLFLGQRIMQYRANLKILNPRFLLYAFLSPELKCQFGAHEGSGSVVSHIRVGDCYKFKIPLPPIDEQERISSILGAIDDRITLLRETNATLEAIAQALFKSWFIDFDPVKAKAEGRETEGMDADTAALFPSEFEASELGAIPIGWKVRRIAEVFDLNPTYRLSKGVVAPYLDMANVPLSGSRVSNVVLRECGSGTKFTNGDTLMARITPCLENGKTAFVDFLEDAQIGWGSTEFIVMRPKSPLPSQFAYLLSRYEPFRTYAIQRMSGTSGRQRVAADAIAGYSLAIPDKSVADAFGNLCGDLFAAIKAKGEQAKNLAELRDTLLPKLMSGQLRLPDAEALMEDAA
jgi:type I restriction enzyme S subunit